MICKVSSMPTLVFLVLITKQVHNTLAKLNIYIQVLKAKIRHIRTTKSASFSLIESKVLLSKKWTTSSAGLQ